ncbi:MAG: 50S ribosomal protein L23 [Parcubacteria group bacterium GW2011_GWC1_35_8]|uniref:Large ribosomal subunit protein uL23 n=3 Tax=Candidatus Nomuraibacteriota TaxID=1752729 RepID=A0A1F6YWE2_9BACT|nr:MAG: 50S ribosomal protein L23 [Parcubacteria group bacterium GW2011_GWC1_35_8]OGJ05742.1 MAG: 50S ribosomal protein L23 [Candidatus Nomurabacteria bacterium RIFOXYA2_FULL_35_9]OGJ06772.1 MAG: 50S ribosomal protein L23 [Candidatus Nomurabacteria bacterium RIFOXYA1_FULL_35_17]OGJ10678.1 MAG: 50S ribosomal protein L23 [Candidatus Nomurabacteria bacterium RIFOXYC2_FULL_36_19]OGJ14857.1 MAG: 50S ribosomal protein L23 [Candidatus Nomurabacteria bacterium RIFOXYD2_FULL_35_12]
MTDIIKNPRITEKASFAQEQNVYTFDVSAGANKTEIKKAIFALYNVKPIRVNVLPVPKKSVFSRGKAGTKGGGRKALVYLKKGDKIEFV